MALVIKLGEWSLTDAMSHSIRKSIEHEEMGRAVLKGKLGIVADPIACLLQSIGVNMVLVGPENLISNVWVDTYNIASLLKYNEEFSMTMEDLVAEAATYLDGKNLYLDFDSFEQYLKRKR